MVVVLKEALLKLQMGLYRLISTLVVHQMLGRESDVKDVVLGFLKHRTRVVNIEARVQEVDLFNVVNPT